MREHIAQIRINSSYLFLYYLINGLYQAKLIHILIFDLRCEGYCLNTCIKM